MAASVVQDTKEKGVKYVSTYYNNNLWSRNYPSLTPTEKKKKERKRLVPEKIHNKDAENGLIRFRSIVQLRNISHSLQ